jgi:hypothetical protein
MWTLVLIVGEPGLGKSRLIEEFHARVRETPHTWVEWSCSQLRQNTPLHPIAESSRMRFGGADVPAEQRLADLETSLAQVHLDPVENATLLAPLLDIPLPSERASGLAPEELRRRQLSALTSNSSGWPPGTGMPDKVAKRSALSRPGVAPVATPSNRQSTGRIPATASRAATKCISEVPGFAKQTSTPQLTSV